MTDASQFTVTASVSGEQAGLAARTLLLPTVAINSCSSLKLVPNTRGDTEDSRETCGLINQDVQSMDTHTLNEHLPPRTTEEDRTGQ